MSKEFVILVDEQDHEIGVEEKMQAHVAGKLHRAFSVFLFNSKNEMLLQRRALEKYHSGGLWTNACCSHPRPGETTENAARRRLQEEMGIRCEIKEAFGFIYRAAFENGLVEHEYDHVFVGRYDGTVEPLPEEAMDYSWAEVDAIQNDLKSAPEKYSVWLRIALPKVLQRLGLAHE